MTGPTLVRNALRDGWGWAAVLGFIQVVVVGLMTFEFLRVRVATMLAIVVLGFGLLRFVKMFGARDRLRLAGFVFASIAVRLVADLGRVGPWSYETGRALVPVFLAWAFVLTLVVLPASRPRRWLNAPVNLALLLFVAAGTWIVGVAASGSVRPWIVDEVLYVMQAHEALHYPFMHPMDSGVARFFQLRMSYVSDGYLNGQYPPGWPLMLSLFPGAGARLVLLLFIHLWLMAATYAYGRTIAGRCVGLLAAVLVATSGFEVQYSMSFFPHVFTAALMLTAGTLLTRGFRDRGMRQVGSWTAAGVLVGFGFATRPLTGLALGLALVLVALIHARPHPRSVVSLLGLLAVGAALPIGYFLWYNHVTTGGFLRLGYDVANHGLQSLGFGTRGFVTYKGQGLPLERLVVFGFERAIGQFASMVQGVFARCWPSALALPLLFLARHFGVRPRWRYVAPFALLPLAYGLYFFQSDRYMFSLLPFAMLGTAWLVLRIAKKRTTVAIALAAVLVCTHAVEAVAALHSRNHLGRRLERFSSAVESTRGAHPRLLVFVRDTSPGIGEPIFEALYAYNLVGSFHGDVVVARDIGAVDTLLAVEYAGYVPVRLSLVAIGGSADPWRWDPLVTPLAREAAPRKPGN